MNPWWCKTLFDPSVFWVMVTGAATAVLTVVAAWQLSALARTSRADFIFRFTAVRLKLEQNQLVDVVGEIGVLVDRLKSA